MYKRLLMRKMAQRLTGAGIEGCGEDGGDVKRIVHEVVFS